MQALYGALFSWIVNKVSNSMAAEPNASCASSIGVLDIFGFEVMPVNSFEQLCINYANEKLHQQFVRYDTYTYLKDINRNKQSGTACVDDFLIQKPIKVMCVCLCARSRVVVMKNCVFLCMRISLNNRLYVKQVLCLTCLGVVHC